MEDSERVPGCRVECEGHHGTLRFIGDIPGTRGVWLGVEWDDPSRGKHDGTHEGKHYFNTRHPTSGSFVRPKKVTYGTPFLAALRERYGQVDDGSGGVEEEAMFVLGHNQQTKVQVVGALSVNLKQSQFEALAEVSLRGCLVSRAGDKRLIGETLPLVAQLDVSNNLLSTWEEVGVIAGQLPRLVTLNVSNNRLVLPDDASVLAENFPKVHTLFLNRMDYTWKEVLASSTMYPSLQTLHVCFNSIKELTLEGSSLHNLRLLNFEANCIGDWQQVLNIGQLPSLEKLILNDTKLTGIVFPDVTHGHTTKFFTALRSLSIANNQISEWQAIDELNKLQSLEDLKAQSNPIMDAQDEVSCRYLMLAKLPRLQFCNRTKVDAEERRGAALDYIRTFGKAWRKSGGNQDPAQNKPAPEFTQLHPRYQALIDRYGALEDSELKEQSTAIQSTLIAVTVKNPDQPQKAPLKKKLPGSLTVEKLKAMLARIYKVDSRNMLLSYTSLQMPDAEVEFDNDMKEISFYSIENGDVILVKC